MYDLNDAEPQRGGLIDPCFAKIVGVLRPGGADGPAPCDRGLLKASKSGTDVLMLDWEFTVAEGPNARRKFWQTMVVAGGEVDEKGQSKGWNITKSQLRAMIDSALALNPKDESESARQRRRLQGFAPLSGIGFIAKIGVKKNKDGQYPDQNVLSHIVTPDEKEWQPVMNGQEVPVGGAAAANKAAPSWDQNAWGGQPATAPTAPAAQQPAWPAQAQASGWPPAAVAPVPPPATTQQPAWTGQAPAPAWPPAATPAAPPPPVQQQPAWPVPQPAGWQPAAAAPAVAPAAGAMPGPDWINGR